MNDKTGLTFSLDGRFITKMQRDLLYNPSEDTNYTDILNVLLSCMNGSQEDKKLVRYAEDVLLGRARFSGITTDNSFGLEILSADEVDDTFNYPNIFREYIEKCKEIENLKIEIYELNSVLGKIGDKYDYVRNTNEEQESNPLLDSFLERYNMNLSEDYGWLEPSGKFHSVSFGNHQKWAVDWVEEHLSYEELETLDTTKPVRISCEADYLLDRGWVLLHNPSQGMVYSPTYNRIKGYTKAQKEFLYDYFMERNMEEQANKLYAEE